MFVRPALRAVAAVAAITLTLTLLLPASVAAARDRTPPTAPTNLRVTGTTMSSATLAWNRSTDNSGNFWYEVSLDGIMCCWSVGPSQTTFTVDGLNPGQTYSFRVKATDGSGNTSGWSNTATGTTPADTVPPTTPTNLRVTGVTPSAVSLAWNAATDNFLSPGYQVFVDGQPASALQQTGTTSVNVIQLTPGATYTFSVMAVDSSGNQSGTSNAVTATTEASTDTTPPTAPTNLTIADQGCGEVRASWTASSDDTDSPSAIFYQIYVNGRQDIGVTGITSTPAYGDHGSSTFTVVAIDRAGNVSPPSNAVTLDIFVC